METLKDKTILYRKYSHRFIETYNECTDKWSICMEFPNKVERNAWFDQWYKKFKQGEKNGT